MLVNKHKKDREMLEQENDEKRSIIKKYETEYREVNNQKIIMKK